MASNSPGQCAQDQTCSSSTKPAPRNVEGWANDTHIRSGGPTVVVSADASPQNLLGWARGQIEQLNVMLQIIGVATHTDETDPAELVGSIRHQLEQILRVIEAAHDRLPA